MDNLNRRRPAIRGVAHRVSGSRDSRHHPDKRGARDSIVLVAEQAALHTDRNSYSACRSGQKPQCRADHPVLVALSVQVQYVQSVSRARAADLWDTLSDRYSW